MKFKIGDTVRVKPSVVTPSRGWGMVTHKSIGQVIGFIKDSDSNDVIMATFPESKKWTATESDLEHYDSRFNSIEESLNTLDKYIKTLEDVNR